jgi:hypothetical protein
MADILTFKFEMQIGSGNQAVVDAPQDAIMYAVGQLVGPKTEELLSGDGANAVPRCRNGSRIGYACTEIKRREDESDDD